MQVLVGGEVVTPFLSMTSSDEKDAAADEVTTEQGVSGDNSTSSLSASVPVIARLDFCPVCSLDCSCAACTRRLENASEKMDAECKNQGVGVTQVVTDDLFGLLPCQKSGAVRRKSSTLAKLLPFGPVVKTDETASRTRRSGNGAAAKEKRSSAEINATDARCRQSNENQQKRSRYRKDYQCKVDGCKKYKRWECDGFCMRCFNDEKRLEHIGMVLRSTEETIDQVPASLETPVKRGRGRPKGSKSKLKRGQMGRSTRTYSIKTRERHWEDTEEDYAGGQLKRPPESLGVQPVLLDDGASTVEQIAWLKAKLAEKDAEIAWLKAAKAGGTSLSRRKSCRPNLGSAPNRFVARPSKQGWSVNDGDAAFLEGFGARGNGVAYNRSDSANGAKGGIDEEDGKGSPAPYFSQPDKEDVDSCTGVPSSPHRIKAMPKKKEDPCVGMNVVPKATAEGPIRKYTVLDRRRGGHWVIQSEDDPSDRRSVRTNELYFVYNERTTPAIKALYDQMYKGHKATVMPPLVDMAEDGVWRMVLLNDDTGLFKEWGREVEVGCDPDNKCCDSGKVGANSSGCIEVSNNARDKSDGGSARPDRVCNINAPMRSATKSHRKRKHGELAAAPPGATFVWARDVNSREGAVDHPAYMLSSGSHVVDEGGQEVVLVQWVSNGKTSHIPKSNITSDARLGRRRGRNGRSSSISVDGTGASSTASESPLETSADYPVTSEHTSDVIAPNSEGRRKDRCQCGRPLALIGGLPDREVIRFRKMISVYFNAVKASHLSGDISLTDVHIMVESSSLVGYTFSFVLQTFFDDLYEIKTNKGSRTHSAKLRRILFDGARKGILSPWKVHYKKQEQYHGQDREQEIADTAVDNGGPLRQFKTDLWRQLHMLSIPVRRGYVRRSHKESTANRKKQKREGKTGTTGGFSNQHPEELQCVHWPTPTTSTVVMLSSLEPISVHGGRSGGAENEQRSNATSSKMKAFNGVGVVKLFEEALAKDGTFVVPITDESLMSRVLEIAKNNESARQNAIQRAKDYMRAIGRIMLNSFVNGHLVPIAAMPPLFVNGESVECIQLLSITDASLCLIETLQLFFEVAFLETVTMIEMMC